MNANIKECKTHGYYAAGFGVCPECTLPREHLITPHAERKQVSVKRQKRGRKAAIDKLQARYQDTKLSTATEAVETPEIAVNAQPVPFRVVKPKRVTGIKPILAKLTDAGMTTNNLIYEGVRTGKVVQTISWQVSYDKVLDYLETQGFNVTLYRSRIVCGGEAA